MNETIWVCTEDLTIYPNREIAQESYRQWCEDVGETYSKQIFENCYAPITFEEYNNSYCL